MSTRRRRSADQHAGAHALELAGVSKAYEVGGVEFVALDHVDLAVAYNEVVTLLGPSGSGKTTLLSIAGGLLTASTGRVVVDGHDITRASARKLTAFRRRQVGFIFQAVNLVPFLTARENLLVVAELAGRQRGRAKRRADQLLDELGLAHRMGNLPSQLSGGERQRVAIGRALMNEPALVLVDEPTSALDSDLGQQVMELIVFEVKARGAAAVIVTHDVRMTRYGDRVLTMADGRIAEMAPRSEWITSRRAERDEPPVSGALPAAGVAGQPPATGGVRPVAAGAALPPPRPSTRRPPRAAPPPSPPDGGSPGWPGGWEGASPAGAPEPHERGNDDRGRASGPAGGPHVSLPAARAPGNDTWDRGAVGPPAGDPTTGRSPLPRREPGLGYSGGPHEDDAAGGARPPLPPRVPGPGGHPGRPGPASGSRRVPSTRRPVAGAGAAGSAGGRGPAGPPAGPRPARRRPGADAGPSPGRGVGGQAPLRRRPPLGGGPGPGLGGPSDQLRDPRPGPAGPGRPAAARGQRPGLGGPGGAVPAGGPGAGPGGPRRSAPEGGPQPGHVGGPPPHAHPGPGAGRPRPRRGPAPDPGPQGRGPAPAGGPGDRPADPRERGPMPGSGESPPRLPGPPPR